MSRKGIAPPLLDIVRQAFHTGSVTVPEGVLLVLDEQLLQVALCAGGAIWALTFSYITRGVRMLRFD